jgi:GTP diphosphokinase / guanosine-3',5'-bis(diphosphate) 3'-diphosphatase
MHIQQLQKFLSYTPVFDENPQHLVDEIISETKKYIPDLDKEKIQFAYEFAKAAHSDWKRHSWEPYIVHPLKATIFLLAIKPDVATIQACILHDVIEDTEIPYETILREFGREVADLCEWLVKVSKVRYQWEERHLETLKKTFLAMGKDLRVIFIKLADRVHNIQTLKYHPKEEKQRRIADETLQIYMPIAKRLGLYYFQQLLENGAFSILYPKEFAEISQHLEKQFPHQQDIIERGIEKIKSIIQEAEIPFLDVKWRIKSPYRIREKMHYRYKDFDLSKVHDLIAFRVITEETGDCYIVMGIIHKHFTPLINKIKDYIALPKFNWYRSLHTTVLWLYDFPVEIQMRSREMDERAEWGVAAHFAYAENKWVTSANESQAVWIKKLQDLVTTYTNNDDKEWFKNTLNIEFLDRNIFIYTQKWDVIEMPEGSTVLDFAFRIHSDLWLKFQNALVNWNIVQIWHKLKTWDVVIVQAFKNKISASWNRQEYLHTPSAKAKLTKYLKSMERDQLLQKSRLVLEQKLLEYHLPPLFSKDDLITKEYKGDQFDRVLIQLLDKQVWYLTFIKRFYKNRVDEQWAHLEPKKTIHTVENPEVVIDWWLRLWHFMCPECRPTIQEKIIARSWKDGIKIHRIDCVALASVSPEKLLEAHREWSDISRYTCNLKLHCHDKPWVLLDLLWIFTSLTLNIAKIHSENVDAQYQYVYITCDTSHPSKLSYLIKELKTKSDTIKIIKRDIS